MDDNKDTVGTDASENNKQVLASGQKVITPIHSDIKPESPITEPKPVEPVMTEQPAQPAPTPEPVSAPVAPSEPVASTTPFESYSASSIAAADTAQQASFIKRWTGQTRAYLAEYAVQLIVLSALIALVNSFFAGIISSFGESSSNILSSWMYQVSLGQLAAVVAIIPLLLLLSRRTSGTEEESPAVKESNWRKAFLGVFLIVIGLTAVGYAISFVYVIVSMIANAGLAVDAETSPLLSLVKSGFGFVLFGVSALLYARDYRPSVHNTNLWRTIHRYGLVVLAVILAIVFVAIPLQKQRGAYVDKLVVGDLQSIVSKISAYAYDERKLPTDLNSVDLSKETKSRLASQKYEYKPAKTGGSYELCATFKTDASDKKSNDVVSALSGVSRNTVSTPISTRESPSTHKKGYQCFKQTASGVRSSSPSSTRLPNNTFLDDSYDDYNYDDTDLELN